MPIIGGHVSAAAGLYNCFANAEKIGAQCFQIFGATPRGWTANQPLPEIVKKFKEEQKRTGLGPIFLHAAYLPNLGSRIPPLWEKSVENLAAHLQIAKTVGAQGLIYHIGASDGDRAKAHARVAKGMLAVLKKVPGKTQLIMENGAAGGTKLGGTPEEIGEIYAMAKKHPRIKVCLDTQHLFAAGVMKDYSEKEIKELVKRCETAFGWNNVVAFHANDSMSDSGSHYDRHENIGAGKIGLKGFQNLAKNKQTGTLPWILEVPGFDDTGPDKKNIDILKSL